MFRSSYGRIKKCRIKYYSIYPFPSVSLLFLQTSSKIVFQRILSKICPIKLFLFHLGQFISRMNCSNAIIFLGLCFFFKLLPLLHPLSFRSLFIELCFLRIELSRCAVGNRNVFVHFTFL